MKKLKNHWFFCLLFSTAVGIIPTFADKDNDDKRQDRHSGRSDRSEGRGSDRSDRRGEDRPRQNRAQDRPQRSKRDANDRQSRSVQIKQQRPEQRDRNRQIQFTQPKQQERERERDQGNRPAISGQIMQKQRDQRKNDRNRSGRSFQDRSTYIQKRRNFDEGIRRDQTRSNLNREINRLPLQDRVSLRKQAELFRKDRKSKVHSADFNKRAKDIKESYSKRSANDRIESRDVSNRVKRHYSSYNHWFTPSFYQNRRHFHGHYWREDVNWWRGAPWNRVYSWLGWGGAAGTLYPIYYTEGYPVQFDSGWTDSYNDASFPQTTQGTWLPLGVFALGSTADEAANSDMFVQLAVNRNGELSGTYYNAAMDQSFPLIGFIDPETQEAYWQVPGERSAPEMATGIFNLTQDVADVELTFSNRLIQNWTLVRISQ